MGYHISMSQRRISLAEGEFYHVFNRGNSKQVIFKDEHDYRRFCQLLYASNSSNSFVFRDLAKSKILTFDRGELLVAIGAYCLMPNHFHMLLTPLVENGISKFMQKVSTGYSMYFNQRYQRTGTLFEGKFKAEHAGRDEYLKYLFAYIHLNPVKLIQSDWKEQGIQNAEQALQHAKSYSYSSLPDYAGVGRMEKAILTPDPFPAYFLTVAATEANLLEWLRFKPEST